MTPDGGGEKAPFIPVCTPLLGGNEERYLAEAVREGWISSAGPRVKSFEEGFARFCGVPEGVSASSGTAALHLALLALDVGPGDEVILPDFTMVACLFAVLYAGARPVFVDADPETWCMDPALVEERMSAKTKALMAVHIYGHPCDMDALLEISGRRGVPLLEDAAEAHGASVGSRVCGSFGAAAAFSFFANKIVTTGEGGMVVTSDRAIAERCRYLRNMCFPLDGPRDFRHDDLGYNYRMTNLQAAVGLAQLERIDDLVERRRTNARRYLELLDGLPGLTLPTERPGYKNVYWMFGVLVDEETFGLDRDGVMAALRERGIDSRRFFSPLHGQGVLTKLGLLPEGSWPVSDDLAARGLYLPSGPGLAAGDIERVAAVLQDLAKKA